MSLWRKYLALNPRTRIFLGTGVMGYAGLALFLSDKAEEKLQLAPSEEDKESLKSAIPRIRFVEKDDSILRESDQSR